MVINLSAGLIQVLENLEISHRWQQQNSDPQNSTKQSYFKSICLIENLFYRRVKVKHLYSYRYLIYNSIITL